MTLVSELDFDHTVEMPGTNKCLHKGATVRGTLQDGGSYFGTVEFSTGRDAIILIQSHTYPSHIKTGQRVRYLFEK